MDNKNVFVAGNYDVIVVGAGHAGVEAALAAARIGCNTLLTTLSMDNIAMMPCNPSVGGPAKGHLVRELDALGGEMGVNADKTCIQFRMLNTGKGPAVHALRAQADKKLYQFTMKETCENTENLDVKQLLIDKLLVEDGKVTGVQSETGEIYQAKAVIMATGTYLKGRIIIGEHTYEGGPAGQRAAVKFSDSIKEAGVKLMRFKTGTPARVDARTLDYSKMEIQPGDAACRNFSFMSDEVTREQIPCYLTYTNEETHKILRDNMERAPMANGIIEGIGPRYCPSIETKILRFPDKERHQLFLEPEGRHTNEVYVQGMSTSMPMDVQLEFLRTIPGLENASGYEEAAAQGIIAGINAAMFIKGEEPLILKRSEAYIGVLIDDLVTKGTNEPYRIMTSRAEYRLLLRQDNADQRLTPLGRRVGLVKDDRWARFTAKQTAIKEALAFLENNSINPTQEITDKLTGAGIDPIRNATSFYDLLRRPAVDYDKLAGLFDLPELAPEVKQQVEITITYEGYIKKQLEQVERMEKKKKKLLPENLNYDDVPSLRDEGREKLKAIRPRSVGQASRISGVSPADISVLLIWLEQQQRLKAGEGKADV